MIPLTLGRFMAEQILILLALSYLGNIFQYTPLLLPSELGHFFIKTPS